MAVNAFYVNEFSNYYKSQYKTFIQYKSRPSLLTPMWRHMKPENPVQVKFSVSNINSAIVNLIEMLFHCLFTVFGNLTIYHAMQSFIVLTDISIYAKDL